MAKKKAAPDRHSLTLEMVKAQLNDEDATDRQKQIAEAARDEACRKAFEPIRAMWLEIADGPDEEVSRMLKASVVMESPTKLKFGITVACNAFTMMAFCYGGSTAELHCCFGEDGMVHGRRLEDVQAEFVKYLARRLRPVRSRLNI